VLDRSLIDQAPAWPTLVPTSQYQLFPSNHSTTLKTTRIISTSTAAVGLIHQTRAETRGHKAIDGLSTHVHAMQPERANIVFTLDMLLQELVDGGECIQHHAVGQGGVNPQAEVWPQPEQLLDTWPYHIVRDQQPCNIRQELSALQDIYSWIPSKNTKNCGQCARVMHEYPPLMSPFTQALCKYASCRLKAVHPCAKFTLRTLFVHSPFLASTREEGERVSGACTL
jgi:hypothetical protein